MQNCKKWHFLKNGILGVIKMEAFWLCITFQFFSKIWKNFIFWKNWNFIILHFLKKLKNVIFVIWISKIAKNVTFCTCHRIPHKLQHYAVDKRGYMEFWALLKWMVESIPRTQNKGFNKTRLIVGTIMKHVICNKCYMWYMLWHNCDNVQQVVTQCDFLHA